MIRLHQVLFAAFALSGCIDDGSSDSVEEVPVPDDTVFHEVSMTVRADGTVEISEPRPITAGEQRAQNAVKAALANGESIPMAITKDSSCHPFSFWLYDRLDWTGNRICFSGVGSTDLHTWARYNPFVLGTSNWAIAKGSYYAGIRGGTLAGFGRTNIWCITGLPWVGPAPGTKTHGGGFSGTQCEYTTPYCSGGTCRHTFRDFEYMKFDLTSPAFYLTHQ